MRARFVFLALMAAFLAPLLTPFSDAQASDPLRLREDFQVLELHPYLTKADGEIKGEGKVFSIQNGGSDNIELVMTRPAALGLFSAFSPDASNAPPLRLFSSDDREFSAMPGDGRQLRFSVPAGQVQSFYLLGVNDAPVLYLWSPEGRAAFDGRRQTFHASILFLLSLILAMAIAAAAYRRSRRATYAVVMGAGLMVLLASLWMRDVLPNAGFFEAWQANRLLIIQLSFAAGVFMSVLAHVNLIIRQIINRNYWTRVIIVTDIWLVAAIALWAQQIFDAGYAGLLSSELGHIAMAMTCASVLLGAVFVPDRRR